MTVLAAVMFACVFAAITPAAHASTATHASPGAAKCPTSASVRLAPTSQHGALVVRVPQFPNGQTCEWFVVGKIPYAGNRLKALSTCQTLGAEMVSRNPNVREYNCTDFPSLALWALSVYVCEEDTQGNFMGTWWVNTNSGMVFEVTHSETNDGATVDQWPYNGTDTQYWLQVQYDDTYDVLIDVNSGKCLGVSGASTSREAPVVQWTCNGSPDQKWAFSFTGNYAFNGNPVYNIIDQNSGLCLDVPHSSTSQGTALWQYGCNGTSAQGWF
jgi:hypothetical protein